MLPLHIKNKLTNNQNTIDIVNNIVVAALNYNASDIHFLPSTERSVIIQFRIDSIIQNIHTITNELYTKIQIHLKVLAKIDISLTQVSQDGSFNLQNENEIVACRINLCPTIFGQKAVIRIINNSINLDIKSLGLHSSQILDITNALNKNHGLVLVTGPTGCGKTVTLYSILQQLRDNNLSIMATCDPVEITLEGIAQTSLSDNSKLTTPEIIRAFLRQDPDVIMIGEIRDQQTLKAALQAATTGHLVIASIHSNNACHTINRIEHLGFNKNEFIDLINIIISQRLIRKICNICSNNSPCIGCKDGLRGLTGIYEVLTMDEYNTHKIMQGNINDIKISPTLAESARELEKLNITTQKESYRALGGYYY